MLDPHAHLILRLRMEAVAAHPERFTEEERADAASPKKRALLDGDQEEHRRLCLAEDIANGLRAKPAAAPSAKKTKTKGEE